MKKMFKFVLLSLMIATLLLCSGMAVGYATDSNNVPYDETIVYDESAEDAVPTEDTALTEDTVLLEADVPTEPFTWDYLVTIAGAALFTLLVVQFFKVPLDKFLGIPTRVFAYFVALVVMLTATAFTTGLTFQTGLLAAVNAIIAALTAMGTYEVTFKKLNV